MTTQQKQQQQSQQKQQRQKQKSWLVEWLIEVTADTPEEAAREALTIQRDTESLATVFNVYRSYPRSTSRTANIIDLGTPDSTSHSRWYNPLKGRKAKSES